MKKKINEQESYQYGKSIGYEEIKLAIDYSNSQRGLVINLNRLIKSLEQIKKDTRDKDDKQMLAGEIDIINEYKEKLKNGTKKRK